MLWVGAGFWGWAGIQGERGLTGEGDRELQEDHSSPCLFGHFHEHLYQIEG